MVQDSIFHQAFVRHASVVEQSMQKIMPDVEKAAKIIMQALKRDKKILICGNGGSAADSQHFAAELSGRYKAERRALAGIALTVDTSALTAIGNDYGFEKIFSRQVEALGGIGDVLVAFSTSGKSPNVLSAISAARKNKMRVIALTGEKGVSMRKIADIAIVVPAGETARIQEVHEIVYHAWCEAVDAALFNV